MGIQIGVDQNQFAGSHGKSNALKHAHMERLGAEIVPIPMPVGDYCLIDDRIRSILERRGSKLKKIDLIGALSMVIDTKKNLQEVCSNICSSAHNRFRDELILAQENGIRMVVLVEESGINSLDDVFKWVNPRLWWYKAQQKKGKAPKTPPTSGQTLAKAMWTCSKKYGVEWRFCPREKSGKTIISIFEEEMK